MNVPLVVAFGVFVLAAVAVVAMCWALPLAMLAAYGFAWARRTRPGGRASNLLLGGLAGLVGGGLLCVVLLVLTMEGDANRGMKVLGIDLFDPLIALPALAALPIIVVGEALFRRDAPPSA